MCDFAPLVGTHSWVHQPSMAGSIQAFGEAKLIAYCGFWTIAALPIAKVNGLPSCSCWKPRMVRGG